MSLSIIFVVLCGFISSIANSKAATYQAVTLRELTEKEQAKLYLLDKVGYTTYRKMSKIAEAESNFNQDAVNKKTQDFGIFQIHESAWNEKAQELGYENYKTDYRDNIDLAIYIAKQSNGKAWYSSYHKHGVVSFTP